jgi:hypothetical protein
MPLSAAFLDGDHVEVIYPRHRELRAWPSWEVLELVRAEPAAMPDDEMAGRITQALDGHVVSTSIGPAGLAAALWAQDSYPPWYHVVIWSGSLQAMTPSQVRIWGDPCWSASGERHDGDANSIANEFQCQPGRDKGRKKDRQESLSGTSEGDNLVLGGVVGLSAARVSSIANLQGVESRLDWYLDRAVHLDRPDPLTVDHDIVRTTTDLRSDCLMRQLERRRHLLISSCF